MSVKSIAVRAALAAMSHTVIARSLVRSIPNRLAVLMLHRFASAPNHARGHTPSELRTTLELLRESGVRLLSLDDAVREYLDGANGYSSHAPSVVFTVDDGYRDFMEVGLPVFEAFDCPVTCFVVPDVIDGKSWFWWDRLDFVLRRLPAEQLSLDVAGERFEVRRSTHEYSWQRPLVNMLKGRSEEFRSAFMAELETRAEVLLPRVVPDEYRVMTWDAIRSCEKRGVQFGAHSLSHPVLSQVSPEALDNEIRGSVQRLHAELSNPSSVFCYPYGLACDFGSREVEALRAAGVTHAVTALPGVVRPAQESASAGPEHAWRIPRFAFDGRPAMTLRQLLLS